MTFDRSSRRDRLDSIHARIEAHNAEFDRQLNRAQKFAAGWFVFCAALSVTILALVGWAVVKLVNHFT